MDLRIGKIIHCNKNFDNAQDDVTHKFCVGERYIVTELTESVVYIKKINKDNVMVDHQASDLYYTVRYESHLYYILNFFESKKQRADRIIKEFKH